MKGNVIAPDLIPHSGPVAVIVTENDDARVAQGVRAALRVLAPLGADDETLRRIAREAGIAPDALLPAPPRVLNSTGGTYWGNGTHAAPTEGDCGPDHIALLSVNALPATSLPAASSPAPARRTGTQENRTLAADMSQLALLTQAPMVRADGSVTLGESFASALRSLKANKTRAILTMLGIIIGVSLVIIQLSVGSGLTGYIREDFERGLASVVVVEGGEQRVNGIATGKPAPTLTLEEVRLLAAPGAIPDVVAVAATTQGNGQITHAGANAAVGITGVSANYAGVQDYTVARGDFITEGDVTNEAAVIALGPNVARTLFGETDPLGEPVFLNGKSLRVIGVMEEKGAGGLDDGVYIPLTTAMNRVLANQVTSANGQKVVSAIYVKATGIGTVPAVEAQVQQLLDARYGTTEEGRDYKTSTSLSIVTQVLRIISVINLGLVVVAGISLLIGGVGITNIMLVSVTERTREIGIRKAIGAKQGDILAQFVVEAVLISLVGALIAVGIGGIGVLLVNVAWRPAPVSPFGIAAAVAAAVATGVLFGVSPARRAARLKPIEALRSE